MATLLITGGTGSFGTTVLKRYVNDPRYERIIIFSRDEKKQHDLMHEFPPPRVKYVIGDVRHFESIRHAMDGVDVVFHAAALKHVPTGEFFPMEMARTNLMGTDNVFRAAKEAGVKKVVLLSTDKAVYPVNAMGMTKALAEKLMTSYATMDTPTVYVGVRYGNVMASRGSVIPLFVGQIKKGKEITITQPEMTRFMLSLSEAADLVEYAIEQGRQGNIFVRKSPAATVDTIAKTLKSIFKAENPVKIIGTRKAEKIHETLASAVELMASEDLGDFYRIRTKLDIEPDEYFRKGVVNGTPIDYSSDQTLLLDEAGLTPVLLSLPYVQQELAAGGFVEPLS
jgi:UDP-N-acetylglucosamine 4,6-dehydratase/5-epimerase